MVTKKNNYLLKIILIGTIFKLHCAQESETPTNYYTIVNDNSQKMFLKEGGDDPLCQDCQGEQLYNCYNNLTNSEKKEAFKQFRASKRKDYLQQLQLDDYEKLIQEYTEQEWDELYQSLSDEEKEYWPKTIEEQKENIVIIRQEADKVSTFYHATTFAVTLYAPPILVPLKIILDVGAIAATGNHPVLERALRCHYEKHMKKSFDLTIHTHNIL